MQYLKRNDGGLTAHTSLKKERTYGSDDYYINLVPFVPGQQTGNERASLLSIIDQHMHRFPPQHFSQDSKGLNGISFILDSMTAW